MLDAMYQGFLLGLYWGVFTVTLGVCVAFTMNLFIGNKKGGKNEHQEKGNQETL